MVTSHDYTSVHQDWSGDYVQKKGQALPAQDGLWSLSWTDWSGGPDLSWAVLAKLSLMLSLQDIVGAVGSYLCDRLVQQPV